MTFAQYGETKKYMKYKSCTLIITQNLPLREHIIFILAVTLRGDICNFLAILGIKYSEL